MASEVHAYGTNAQVVAAIQAMTPSNHQGMADLLTRVKGYVLNEIASFTPLRTGYSVYVSCHHDATISTINIRVYPANIDGRGAPTVALATVNNNAPDA